MKSILTLLVTCLFCMMVGCASLRPPDRVENYTPNQRRISAVQTEGQPQYNLPRSRKQASENLKGKGCRLGHPYEEKQRAEPITGTVATIGNATVRIEMEKFGPELVIEMRIIGTEGSEHLSEAFDSIPRNRFP